MTMSVDSVLSRAKKVIEDVRATDRCVGVLTKPDTLADREKGTSDFENILRGKEHQLKYGWHVTKQPGPNFQADEPEYHRKARKEEEDFFAQDHLWQGPWSGFQDRCGTVKIQKVLSNLLATSIMER